MSTNTIRTNPAVSLLSQASSLCFPASISVCPCCASLALLFLPKSKPLALLTVTLLVACLSASLPFHMVWTAVILMVKDLLCWCITFFLSKGKNLMTWWLQSSSVQFLPSVTQCAKDCLKPLSWHFLMTCFARYISLLLERQWRYKT